MACFSKLPRELIIEVWSHLRDPEAIDNFALTSKTIRSLGSSFIEEHNKLRLEFSSFPSSDIYGSSNLAELLEALLLNPRAALYVRDVYIDSWPHQWDDPDPEFNGYDEFEHDPYPKKAMELFKQAVKDSPFIYENEVESWIDELVVGNEGAILSLVVMRLPNAKSFDLFDMGASEFNLSTTVRRIAESQDTDALSRLTNVQLHPRIPALSDWVQAFSPLPSVKAIKAQCIGNDGDVECLSDCWSSGKIHRTDCHARLDIRFTLSSRTSAVVHLTCCSCGVRKNLAGFLEGLPALEHFDYLGVPSFMEFSEPSEIVSALLTHAKHSLQVLRLGENSERTTCTVSLADFQVLKELDIKSDLLLSYKDTPERSQLADLLPKSVEKVHLRRLHTDVAHLVENTVLQMALHKAERLPNLKELTIELIPSDNAPNSEVISKIKQKCEGVGVKLNVTTDSSVSIRSSVLGPRAHTGW